MIDVKAFRVETPEEVADRARLALKHVPAERLWLVPDCGLWETPRWVAIAKLRSMVEAARVLRHELGAARQAGDAVPRQPDPHPRSAPRRRPQGRPERAPIALGADADPGLFAALLGEVPRPAGNPLARLVDLLVIKQGDRIAAPEGMDTAAPGAGQDDGPARAPREAEACVAPPSLRARAAGALPRPSLLTVGPGRYRRGPGVAGRPSRPRRPSTPVVEYPRRV